MVLNLYLKQFFDGGFDLLNAGVTKFNNLPRIREYNVVMLLGTVGFFELCKVFSKLMFSNQVAC